MNFQDFLNYRDKCPLCNEKLLFSFHSARRQTHIVQDNRYVVLFEMRNIGKGGDKIYYAGFSFDLKSNDFFIDFYNKDKKQLYDHIPISIIKRFEEFYVNLQTFRLYNTCAHCTKYTYVSKPFDLDFINKTMTEISIEYEYFGMSAKEREGSYKIYRLTNYPLSNRSNLLCFYDSGEDSSRINCVVPIDAPYFDLPMIKFVSAKETYARITKLLIFS